MPELLAVLVKPAFDRLARNGEPDPPEPNLFVCCLVGRVEDEGLQLGVEDLPLQRFPPDTEGFPECVDVRTTIERLR